VRLSHEGSRGSAASTGAYPFLDLPPCPATGLAAPDCTSLVKCTLVISWQPSIDYFPQPERRSRLARSGGPWAKDCRWSGQPCVCKRTSPEAKLACLEVFAFGGPSPLDNATKTGYFAIRASLARSISEAAQHIAQKGVAQEGAPVIVRFITRVASRFGVAVSEKLAAQAVPMIGAMGGALINSVFIDHFQDMARGHFIIRRLERTYDPDLIKHAYDKA